MGFLTTRGRETATQDLLIFANLGTALGHPQPSGASHASKYPQEGPLSVLAHNARPASMAHQRRSQRILLCVRVIVSGKHANGSPFSEHTTTQVVNAHGALILLHEPVVVGQLLNIKHVATGEELVCTVMDLTPGQLEIPEIGIEFVHPNARFWRVSFPPEDWTPRSPYAKRFAYRGTPLAAKPPEVKK